MMTQVIQYQKRLLQRMESSIFLANCVLLKLSHFFNLYARI